MGKKKSASQPVGADDVEAQIRNCEARLIYEAASELMDDEKYDKALRLYRKAKFIDAREQFEALANFTDTNSYKLYKMYQKRCEHLIAEKINNFDGVFNFTTK